MFRQDVSLQQLNALSEKALMRPLGIVFTEIGTDYLCATMPVDARTHQPYGVRELERWEIRDKSKLDGIKWEKA